MTNIERMIYNVAQIEKWCSEKYPTDNYVQILIKTVQENLRRTSQGIESLQWQASQARISNDSTRV